jgi:hypothetical protein
MFRGLKRLTKRFYVKWKLKSRYKWLQEERKNTEAESVCLSICRSLISHPTSKFLIAPISMKRYIKNEQLGLFIILEDRNISVTNHVYHYDVKLSERDWDRICTMYDSKTEKIREEYESEIMRQIQHSLRNIKDKIEKLNQTSQDISN